MAINSNSQHNYQLKKSNRRITNLINWFVFFLSFPAINILGNSITFYIFIGILLNIGLFGKQNFPGKNYFLIYLIIAATSTILAPYIKMPRHLGIISSIQMLIQYSYWILVATFFSIYYAKINKVEMAKWLFYGLIMSAFFFYFLPIKFDLGLLDVNTKFSRNAFIFVSIGCIPISIYYLSKRYHGIKFIAICLILFLIVLFANGRSGAVIAILEFILIYMIFVPSSINKIKYFLIPLVALFVFIFSNQADVFSEILAQKVESINPRFADLIRGEGEGDLTMDKSWLHRKLMIDKGIEIFYEYPILGIGPNNFIYYDSQLDSYDSYSRLTNETKEYYNSRSAHNSYVQTLAEMGILGFISLLLILFPPIIKFFKDLLQEKVFKEQVFIISLLAIAIHFYAIAALSGAMPWFIIGMAWKTKTRKI